MMAQVWLRKAGEGRRAGMGPGRAYVRGECVRERSGVCLHPAARRARKGSRAGSRGSRRSRSPGRSLRQTCVASLLRGLPCVGCCAFAGRLDVGGRRLWPRGAARVPRTCDAGKRRPKSPIKECERPCTATRRAQFGRRCGLLLLPRSSPPCFPRWISILPLHPSAMDCPRHAPLPTRPPPGRPRPHRPPPRSR